MKKEVKRKTSPKRVKRAAQKEKAPEKEESRWQEFLRRHGKAKKGGKNGSKIEKNS